MLSRKKITAVSWLLGGIAVTCVSATHSYAAGPQGHCTRDSQGITCKYHHESSYTSEDGTYHLNQTQNCTTEDRERVETPQSGTGKPGTTRIGPSVGCSNNAPAPANFKAPHISR